MTKQMIVSDELPEVLQRYLNEGWLFKAVTPKGLVILERHEIEQVPEMKPEDIVKPLSALDEISDDEVLYWSTPYYDELQARKDSKQDAINQEVRNG